MFLIHPNLFQSLWIVEPNARLFLGWPIFVGSYGASVEGQLLDKVLGNILKENMPIAFLIQVFLVHLSLWWLVCSLHRSYDTRPDNTDKASIDLVDIKVQLAKLNLGSLVTAHFSFPDKSVYVKVEWKDSKINEGAISFVQLWHDLFKNYQF
jgi:hypothetical protein